MFKLFYSINEDKYIPTQDQIRHFNQFRKYGKIDYSKDFHNLVLKKLYSITSGILNEKLKKQFSELIFLNMGNLENLVFEVNRKNEMNPTSNKYKELRDYLKSIIEKIQGE